LTTSENLVKNKTKTTGTVILQGSAFTEKLK